MYMPSYVQFPYSDEVTIKVREFERRPNAEFREGDGVCGEGEAVKLIILI